MIHNTQLIQVVPTLVSGDAISNYALSLNKFCEDNNISSTIIANRNAKDLPHRIHPISSLDAMLQKADGNATLLYHHSLGDEAADILIQSEALLNVKRMLFYHNITPPDLLKPSSTLASLAWLGIRQLDSLQMLFGDYGIAASHFSAHDLIQHGWKNVQVLPYMISQKLIEQLTASARYRVPVNIKTTAPQLLYVGRIVEHKHIESLIDVLYLMKRNRGFEQSRLTIVGNTQLEPLYYQSLVDLCIERWGNDYQAHVCFTGSVSGQERLVQYYTASHLMITASRHEGFCMPLVEAMFASLPVVATDFGAIRETLEGGTGLVVDGGNNALFAEACVTVLNSTKLQEKIMIAQQRNCIKFTMDYQKTIILKTLKLV